jgi:AraC-like DNA-binding protein
MRAESTGIYNFYHVPGLSGVELVRGMNVIHSFPRHAHRYYCIGIIDQGLRKYSSGSRTETIGAGSSLWINPDEVHACNPVDKKGHYYRILCLKPDYFKRLFSGNARTLDFDENRQNNLFFKTNIIKNQALYYQLAILFTTLEQSGSILEKESALLQSFACLLQGDGFLIHSPIKNESNAIYTVRDFLELHYMENVSIDQLVTLTGLSPYYLIRLFQNKVGLSPHYYQTQIRIKQAKRKLVQGESIVDVALETGFNDQSHFTKFFKRLTGLTPGEYQSSVKQ